MKKWWKSRLVWLGLATSLSGIIGTIISRADSIALPDHIITYLMIVNGIVGALVVVLRFDTTTKIDKR